MSKDESEMGETIRLSRKDAADAARLLRILEGEQGKSPCSGINRFAVGSREHPRDLARRWHLARKLRTRFFNPAITGEPAYELLLSLYVGEADATPISLKQITQDSAVAPTTALRWLDYLVDQELVRKVTSELDRRIVLVALTANARKMLDDYFTAIIENGLAC